MPHFDFCCVDDPDVTGPENNKLHQHHHPLQPTHPHLKTSHPPTHQMFKYSSRGDKNNKYFMMSISDHYQKYSSNNTTADTLQKKCPKEGDDNPSAPDANQPNHQIYETLEHDVIRHQRNKKRKVTHPQHHVTSDDMMSEYYEEMYGQSKNGMAVVPTKTRIKQLLLHQGLLPPEDPIKSIIANGICLTICGVIMIVFGSLLTFVNDNNNSSSSSNQSSTTLSTSSTSSSSSSLWSGLTIGILSLLSGILTVLTGNRPSNSLLIHSNLFISIVTVAAAGFMAIITANSLVKDHNHLFHHHHHHHSSTSPSLNHHPSLLLLNPNNHNLNHNSNNNLSRLDYSSSSHPPSPLLTLPQLITETSGGSSSVSSSSSSSSMAVINDMSLSEFLASLDSLNNNNNISVGAAPAAESNHSNLHHPPHHLQQPLSSSSLDQETSSHPPPDERSAHPPPPLIVTRPSSSASSTSSHSSSSSSSSSPNFSSSPILMMNTLLLVISSLTCLLSFVNFCLTGREACQCYSIWSLGVVGAGGPKGVIDPKDPLNYLGLDTIQRKERILEWILQQTPYSSDFSIHPDAKSLESTTIRAETPLCDPYSRRSSMARYNSLLNLIPQSSSSNDHMVKSHYHPTIISQVMTPTPVVLPKINWSHQMKFSGNNNQNHRGYQRRKSLKSSCHITNNNASFKHHHHHASPIHRSHHPYPATSAAVPNIIKSNPLHPNNCLSNQWGQDPFNHSYGGHNNQHSHPHHPPSHHPYSSSNTNCNSKEKLQLMQKSSTSTSSLTRLSAYGY